MARADELRAELARARDELGQALRAAGGNWERKPASGEGEAAWSARQAAEHAIPVEVTYTSAICAACGYPGLERMQASYPTAASAEEGLVQAVELSNGKIKYVTEKDLAMSHERLGPVEGIMRQMIGHLRDHAAQIRAAAE